MNHQVQGYHELKTISVKQARVILHNAIPKKVRKTTNGRWLSHMTFNFSYLYVDKPIVTNLTNLLFWNKNVNWCFATVRWQVFVPIRLCQLIEPIARNISLIKNWVTIQLYQPIFAILSTQTIVKTMSWTIDKDHLLKSLEC